MDNLIITPKTKIYDLLEAYPQLEDVLIGEAPQFKKLKNPVLRKTIARVTSLAQAAVVGGLKVEELILKLRKEVGQEEIAALEAEEGKINTEKPDWFDLSTVVETLDVREKLNLGEHPIHDVMSAIKKLNENEMLKVVVPFIPAPMIEKTLSLEYKHWLVEQSREEYWVYFKA
ncbi:DUF1858 domain-containing protein [Puteibacter caeruleilacunae]|nr:DUF1858 domain-containing protein [Puteibacter caeruleilacunae]